MDSDGVVKLNDEEVGTFVIDVDDRITVSFHRGAAGVRESLEYAAEQGLNFGLQLTPKAEIEDLYVGRR